MSCKRGAYRALCPGLDNYDMGLKRKYVKKAQLYLALGVVAILVGVIAFGAYKGIENKWKRKIQTNSNCIDVVVEKKDTLYESYHLTCRYKDGESMWLMVKSAMYHEVEVGDTISVYEYDGFYSVDTNTIVEKSIIDQILWMYGIETVSFITMLICFSKFNTYQKYLQELRQKIAS